MQGYSVHDLYTKALAVLGLGMLAGIGALVDYWPSMSGLPIPANVRVSPPVQMTVSGIPAGPGSINPTPARATLRARAVAAPASTATSSNVQTQTVLAAALIPAEALGANVPLAALEIDPPPAVEQSVVSFVQSDVPAESAEADYPLMVHAGAPVARALDEDGDGFITGAFRKTGTSIRKTSVKTGSSIVGAIRGFGGAVRRALPVL